MPVMKSDMNLLIDKMPVLQGDRVLLRDVKLTDVNETYHRWMNDLEVNRYMETRFKSQSLYNIRDFVQRMNREPNTIFKAIIVKEENKHIGNVKLGPLSRVHLRGEISFFIGEQVQCGKGLATEAVSLLTAYGLLQLGLLKVTAGVYSNNISSMRVFEKCGYIREAVMRRHYVCEGELVDRICFARFRETYSETEKVNHTDFER